MKSFLLAVTILLSLFFVASCSKEKPEEAKTDITSEEVKKEVGEAVETTGVYLDQKKDEYIRQAEVKMEELGKKTAELENRLEKETAEMKERHKEEILGLKKKQEELQKKINELKSSSAKAWEEFKTGIDAALDDLEKSYEKALSHFEK